MNKYNPNIHHRRSIRLKGYDYAQAGLYFITLCCQDRAMLFGNIQNGNLLLNEYGKIAEEAWLATETIRANCRLHDYIIMPNHIHGIIEIAASENNSNTAIGKFQSPSQTIGAIIRGFKIMTIKKIKDFILEGGGEFSTGELQFAPTDKIIQSGESQFAPTDKIIQLDYKIWQRNYYEHIIRNEKSYHNISQYIINNPAKWSDDKFYLA